MKYLSLALLLLFACSQKAPVEIIQLTDDLSRNFDLDNNDNFSPDDQWLCHDTRTETGGIGGCSSIEMVNVESGEIVPLYRPKNPTEYGPGVGAASFSHVENRVIFIHGLSNCGPEKPYAQWRRTGVYVNAAEPNVPHFLDARDVTPPFTPGALRGGTHRHEWSGNGLWVGFTYNDAIMKNLEDRTGQTWNLRTIGVSKNAGPVTVDRDAAGENINGEWFSVLVVKVVPNQRPGSDEISRAADDSWIGSRGYQKADGSWQRARAFLGVVRNSNGDEIKELFVVDIPEDITQPGQDGPLEGTMTSFPMPPKGTVQRRLTFTADTEYPGCDGIVRSAPDGSRIAFLRRDRNGIKQVFLISPMGGDAEQLTHHRTDVETGVRWHPEGNWVCYVQNNSLVLCDLRHGDTFGKMTTLAGPFELPPINPAWSHDGKTIAFNRLIKNPETGEMSKQIFLLKIRG